MRLSVRVSSLPAAAALAGLTLALAACGTDLPAVPPTEQVLTQAQINAIGMSVASEVEGSASLMTMGNLQHPIAAQPRVVGTPAVSALGLTAPISATAAADSTCPSYAPNPYADADSDGVPDSVTLGFDCHITDPASGFLVDITGSVAVSDPQPTTAGVTMNGSASSFDVSVTRPNPLFTVSQVRNGSWSVTESAGALSESWNLTTVVSATGQPDLTITNSWTATFVPSNGAAVPAGQPLPAGSLTAAGALGVNDGTGGNFSLTLSTPTPLVIDPALCTSGFRRGEARAALTVNGKSGYVSATWANCQPPSYTFVSTG